MKKILCIFKKVDYITTEYPEASARIIGALSGIVMFISIIFVIFVQEKIYMPWDAYILPAVIGILCGGVVWIYTASTFGYKKTKKLMDSTMKTKIT